MSKRIEVDCTPATPGHRRFCAGNTSVAHLVGRLLPGDGPPLTVRCEPGCDAFSTSSGGNVQQVPRDPAAWLGLASDYQRRRWTLAAIIDGLERAGGHIGLPEASWQEAIAEARRQELRSRFVVEQASPDDRLLARLTIDHDVDHYSLELVLTTKSGETIAQAQLGAESPLDVDHGPIRWLSQREAVILGPDGQPLLSVHG